MKLITASSCALFAFTILGCSQHASTVPAVSRPANPPVSASSSDVNTFGDSKQSATDSAASAREQNYRSDDDTGRQADAGAPDAPAPR